MQRTKRLKAVGALLAVNGDYYGARRSGYVIRNGVLYRDSAADGEMLLIRTDGSFEILSALAASAEELLSDGAWQVLCFGPGLVENGEVVNNPTTNGKRISERSVSDIVYIG